MDNIKCLILGSDANAYYMARCYHEAYNKKAHLIGTRELSFTKYTNILTIEYKPLWDELEFVKALNLYATNNKDYKILVISTNETYSEFLASNKDKLKDNLIFANQDSKVLHTLTNKELFYKTYEGKGLVFPSTYYLDVLKDNKIPNMKYPIVIKPANVVIYNHLSFEGKNKIYKVNDKEECERIISIIKKSGYDDRLILQEFIPGDDSYLYDAVCYVGKDKKVKLLSFAEIGIQERTRSMVGNAACLINGLNLYNGPVKEMRESIIKFMEELGMNGFYEFDMKYDYRDNTFKVLEINARQGRCSYYLTPMGANLVEVLMDDLVLNKKLEYRELNQKVLLSFVPKNIIKKYVVNKEFIKEALGMWGSRVSPMIYKKDTSIKRFLMLRKRLWHYNKEYKNSYWEE